MGTTIGLGVVQPGQGQSPWDTDVNSNFLIITNNLITLIAEANNAISNINTIFGHQSTDEASITANANDIAAIKAQSYPKWKTYTVTVSGGNWLVNGSVVAAQSTTNYIQQVPLFTTDASTIFNGIALKTTTAFSGDMPSLVASIGTASIPDTLMSTTGDFYDLKATVTNQNFYVAGGAKVLDFGTVGVVLNVVTSGLNKYISSVTTGVVKISFLQSILP
jgi:hypothetical protein